MPVSPQALTALITEKINSKMMAIDGMGPLAGKNTTYYLAFCKAIGTGIAQGTPTVLFTTQDSGSMGAPPIPGAGVGLGIMVDDAYMSQQIYTQCRSMVISMYQKTNNVEYPPSDGTNGKYLLAVAEGIAESVKELYAVSWALASVNPLVYMGTGNITNGNFTLPTAALIPNLILSNGAPLLQQKGFWPTMAQVIGQVYADTIQNHSTGMVNIIGVCVPSLSQVCGIPSSGTGTGVAS
jgi:hypothetical protein